MPSIASYVNEILTEDMYASSYNDRINERICALNAAQLQGMTNYLQQEQKKCKFPLWKESNNEIITKMATSLKSKADEIEKENKKQEEAKMKIYQKTVKKKAKKVEAVRVMKSVLSRAQEQAEHEIKIEENKRQVEEKREIIQQIKAAEAKREKWHKYILVGSILCIIGACVATQVWYFLVPAITVIVAVAVFVVWKLFRATQIAPMIFTDEEIQNKIEARKNQIQEAIVNEMREKEQKFQELMMIDRIERRNRRRKRIIEEKAKEANDLKQKEEWKLKQMEMASIARSSHIGSSSFASDNENMSHKNSISFDQNQDQCQDSNQYSDSNQDHVNIQALNEEFNREKNMKENFYREIVIHHLIVEDLPESLVPFNTSIYTTICWMSRDPEVSIQTAKKEVVGTEVTYSLSSNQDIEILDQVYEAGGYPISTDTNDYLLLRVYALLKYDKVLLIGEGVFHPSDAKKITTEQYFESIDIDLSWNDKIRGRISIYFEGKPFLWQPQLFLINNSTEEKILIPDNQLELNKKSMHSEKERKNSPFSPLVMKLEDIV